MERVISLQFTTHSVVQSIIVFIVLFALMYVQSVGYVWRSKLIDLFHAANKTEQRVKKWSLFSTVMGLIGIALMIFGYYRATILFTLTEAVTMNELLFRMGLILFSTIFGSFLFFRYTVATIANFIRKRRNGHVTVGDVVALTPMMHRMKSSALSLTLITTLTALAIGVLSLAYISYSSVKTSSQQSMPYDMGVFNGLGQEFEKALSKEDIAFEKNTYHFKTVEFNYKDIMKNELSKTEEELTTSTMNVMKQSEVQQKVKNLSLKENEIAFYNYTKMQNLLAPMQTDKKVEAVELKQSFTLTTLSEDMFVPNVLSFGSPVAVVTDDVYAQMQDVTEGAEVTSFTGYTILNEEDLDQAEKLYREKTNDGEMIIKLKDSNDTVTYDLKTQSAYYENNFQMMGLLIFVAAFLGLAFLLTTGSILYFKQMSEADQEAPQFEMLRKIGFTTEEVMRGVRQKQWFNFGIPLVIGIAHSYFAVRSGWMLFGTDFELPFITVLIVYALLYGAFAWMSVRYYKKVITNK
ncbi:FtsX-like permease family protein [Kurthia senegalensis]|uniref:FtsX-like permease family protein n=1 Tax=Kurthia senegalensis TaxID=1033740 RepID=UPI00028A1C89|nr:FtsX-like permease family protein [Kurthia senegalensis]